MTVISIVHGAPKPQGQAIAAKLAADSAQKLVDVGLDTLGDFTNTEVNNDALFCIVNDWKARDQQANLQCTFKAGRFSKDRKIFGISAGRWYCTYKKAAFEALGHKASC